MCDWKRLKIEQLLQDVDFYWEVVEGVKIRVFTSEYLKSIRTQCCKNQCRHCPWEFKK